MMVFRGEGGGILGLLLVLEFDGRGATTLPGCTPRELITTIAVMVVMVVIMGVWGGGF